VQCAETFYRILKITVHTNYKKISIIHFIIQAHKRSLVRSQGRRKLFSIGGGGGGESEGRSPEELFLNLVSLKCHFLDFGEENVEIY
jgi:hypothetical protein